MTFEILYTLAVLLVTVILFITEKVRSDLVALAAMAALLLARVVPVERGLAGFGNPATVTVAAMFVLSETLFRTGALNFAGAALARLGRRSLTLGLLAIMLVAAATSAFINNTAVVAVFLPMVLRIARESGTSPSKWLIPLSFASMFGGVCTLIGTSTNILVSAIAEQHGQRPFAMFEFSALGICTLSVGMVYMLVIGNRLLPARRQPGDLTETFDMGDYLTEITLLPTAKSVGLKLSDAPLAKDLDLVILQVNRGDEPVTLPTPDTILRAGDVLLVRTSVQRIRALKDSVGVMLNPVTQWSDDDLQSGDTTLIEAVIPPDSSLSGSSLKASRFRNRFDAVVLALRHHGRLVHEKLATTTLQAGDVLLMEARRVTLPRLRREPELVMVSEVGLPEFRRHKILPALLVLLAVVTTATLGLLPIVASAMIGCILLVATRCISLEEAYRAIEWKVIFLLAGVLTLGAALEETGAAAWLSAQMLRAHTAWGPVALISAFYLVTTLMTEVMSNNAAAALLAPVAIAAANMLDVDPRPFLVAVTFAASASFMTPMGYQTNILVYGPGQYRFRDFTRVGTPLNVMFWLLATLLIPRLWPLR